MRIAILTPYYIPVKGGITTYVYNLVLTLSYNFDWNVDVFSRYGYPNKKTRVYSNKLIFIVLTYFNIIRKRYDVLHSHGHWYILIPCVAYKLIKPNTKIIHTFHTQPVKNFKGIKKYIFEYLLSKCNTVTFVSVALEKDLRKSLEIKKTKVIYAGISKKKISDAEVNEFIKLFALSDCKPIISFIGPLAHGKKVAGVKLLIKSFEDIVKKYPRPRLLIIGDGLYKKELLNLAKENNIGNSVVFTGFIDNVYIPLAVTDIYVHITLQEGLGISILEAMSTGKPVIASRTGGIPEIITHNYNGLLVEAEPQSIAEEIIQLYENKVKQEFISENALKTIKEKFLWDKITNQFIEIYGHDSYEKKDNY